jgi:8-oxo-dGTP pyrophosphatase MutT (NUDIX family)
VVLAQLGAHRPVDERERRSLHEVLSALEVLDAPLDQTADPTHLTGSGVVLGRRGVLLHRHRRLGIWVQPGGHIDPGETPWHAAVRESAEETGLSVGLAGGDPPELLHVDVHDGGRGHRHLDLRYLLEVHGDDRPRPPAGESQEVAWFTWEQALALADPGLAGLLAHLRPASASA